MHQLTFLTLISLLELVVHDLYTFKGSKSLKIRIITGADPGFPIGVGANHPGEGGQHTKLPNFPKNCMKLRKIRAVGPP